MKAQGFLSKLPTRSGLLALMLMAVTSVYWLSTSTAAVATEITTAGGPTPTPTPTCPAGVLDPTFGSNGVVRTPVLSGVDIANGVAVQPDGRIVAAGWTCAEPDGNCQFSGAKISFALARYLQDGDLDTSFGSGGTVTTEFALVDRANDIALQPDGKIVAAGRSSTPDSSAFALARYNSDGALDTSFGNGGKVLTAFPGSTSAAAYAVVIQPDGKIVAGGETGGANPGFALVRYNADGSLDGTFGTGGTVTTRIEGRDSQALDLALQADGRIVSAGWVLRSSSGEGGAFAAARYNGNGTLDATFGSGGTVTTPVGTLSDAASAVAIQNDGKIVAAGVAYVGIAPQADYALVRYVPDGTLDAAFGNGGKVVTEIAPAAGMDNLADIVIQPDGRIVAAGESASDVSLARFNPDGSLDTSFNGTGTVMTDLVPNFSGANAVALQEDGKIVAAGYGFGEATYDLAVLRYGFTCGSPTPAPSPTPTPTPTPSPTLTPSPTPTGPCSHNNGGLNPVPVSQSGVAAPAGSFWSELQNNAGDLTASNGTTGYEAQTGEFVYDSHRLADDFVTEVPCTIESIVVYGYLGSGTTSPFTAHTLRIWRGRPDDLESTVVFGDTTTNRQVSSTDTGIFRISNSVVPPLITPSAGRRIWRNTIAVGTTLPPGHYWIDWTATVNNNPRTANFAPTKSIAGVRFDWRDNAITRGELENFRYSDVIDFGRPLSAPNVPQDFPFEVIGTPAGGPTPTPSPTPTPPEYRARADFDGDGITDVSVYRPTAFGSNLSAWYVNGSTSGFSGAQFGLATDIPIPGDYDGDKRTDLAIARFTTHPQMPDFYIMRSATNTMMYASWGQPDDIPTPGDFDGDGLTDVAISRAWSTYIVKSTGGTVQRDYGRVSMAANFNAVPIPMDFDGNGRTNIAYFNAGMWRIIDDDLLGGQTTIEWGLPTDIHVPADYDGDGADDVAVFRPSNGVWYILKSSDWQPMIVQWGQDGDVPVPGDYDGDRVYDVAVYRFGIWYINASTAGPRAEGFGLDFDVPVPRSYRPHAD